MEVKILFDKENIGMKLSIGWGFSCLIDNRILFDTGESGRYLFNNIKLMKIDVSKIEAAVISHDHWDHKDGLWDVLKERPGLKVYACPNFSKDFREKVKAHQGFLIEVGSFFEISKNILVTGEIPGEYDGKYMPEQALILKTEKGVTVITGCAHPGIKKIVDKVKEKFPEEQLYLVFGGFHLMDKDKKTIESIVGRFKEMKVKKVGPTHCSGKEAEILFKKTYKNNFLNIAAGQTIEV